MSFPSEPVNSDLHIRPLNFYIDLDSFMIFIYNHISTFISNNKINFVVPITPMCGHMVRVFIGMIIVVGEGNIQWKIEDHGWKIYKNIIRKAQYVPYVPMYTFAPQKW